jgi:hypothetical protein
MIRSYGFVTCDEICDEGYDDEWGPAATVRSVYSEVLRLCAATEDEGRRLAEQIAEKLIFNARWGIDQAAVRVSRAARCRSGQRIGGRSWRATVSLFCGFALVQAVAAG